MTDTKTQLPKKTRTWTVQLLDAQGDITHQETMEGNKKKPIWGDWQKGAESIL